MELSLIMDYFTCESRDEILDLVDGGFGGGGTFSNSTFNLPLVLFNF
jgi:hypothetical protein